MDNFDSKYYYKIIDILNNYMSYLFSNHTIEDVS